MKKWKEVDNPVLFEDENSEYLDEAKSLFNEVLNEYLDKNPEKHEEINELREELNLAYSKRKAEFLLKNRIGYLNDYIYNAVSFAFNHENETTLPASKLFYLKQPERSDLTEED